MCPFTSRIAVAAIAIAFTMPAALGATANRTWVSHSGLSSNAGLNPPCTPTNPCDTFATALSVTNPGGEVNCVDNGSYGTVNITQSVTIDCGGQLGAIDVGTNSTGVTVNSATAVVKLRNLTINADFNGVTTGIKIQSAADVTIENCVIQNLNGSGIIVQTSNALQFTVTDTLVANNQGGGGGIAIISSGSGTIGFLLERVRAENNGFGNIIVNSGVNGTGTITGVIRDSVITGSTGSPGIAASTSVSNSPITVSLDHTHVTNNATGVVSQGGAAVILNNSTVQTNGTGLVTNNGGAIFSYGNNPINGNQPNGIGAAPILIGLH
jgi:hypothetical protein